VTLSFLFSGILLFLGHRTGFYVSYAQVPFRAAFVLPSLGFLTYALYVVPLADYYTQIIVLLLILEIPRLVVTIVYHRQLFPRSLPCCGSPDPAEHSADARTI
jgi:hypothetical protein